MLDALESRRDALALIKKGCVGVKNDSSRTTLIKIGILRMQVMSEDDIFTKLICAIGYEKMSLYIEAVEHYNSCIEILPDSSMKFGIIGMKYRAMYKVSNNNKGYIKLSQILFDMAIKTETRDYWKKIWMASKEEVEKI